jgi:adenosylcobinamide-phosphate synthase
MDNILILAIALTLDLAIGEVPNTYHPISWLGKLISFEVKLLPKKGKGIQLVLGAFAVLITIGTITVLLFFLLGTLKEINLILYIITSGILLKLAFSIRGLARAVIDVKKLLIADKISKAKISLKSLVSRETDNFGKGQVVAATIESLAENSCDSFIAPLFYFLIFGVPGAIAYRIINTFDSMIGYHGQWEYSGKFAARIDDVVNFIPARIAAVLIVVAAWICKKNVVRSWQIMLRDHNKTQSPNAGWTMSAIAGALEIQLEKTGHYKLGDNHYSLSVNTIDSSLKMILTVILVWSILSFLIQVVYFVTA